MNLHINLLYGRDVHHMLEGIFKAFGRALDQATSIDPASRVCCRQKVKYRSRKGL